MELLAGEKCLLVNEAKTVAPRIVDVKRSFTPRTLNDVARRLTVNIFRRETVQFARPLVHSIDVFDGKVNVIGKRLRFQIGNVQPQPLPDYIYFAVEDVDAVHERASE